MPDLYPSFALLTCDDVKLDFIIDELKTIPAVSEIKQVQGMYDVIVMLHSAPKLIIEETIRTKIRYVDGVRSTLTLLGQKTL